jgi:hypothetical protein
VLRTARARTRAVLPLIVTAIRVAWRLVYAIDTCAIDICLLSVEQYTLFIRVLVIVNTGFFVAIMWQLCLKLRTDLDRHRCFEPKTKIHSPDVMSCSKLIRSTLILIVVMGLNHTVMMLFTIVYDAGDDECGGGDRASTGAHTSYEFATVLQVDKAFGNTMVSAAVSCHVVHVCLGILGDAGLLFPER